MLTYCAKVQRLTAVSSWKISAKKPEVHLAFLVNAHLPCCYIIKHLVDDLDLCIVVACSQGPHLHMPPLQTDSRTSKGSISLQ